MIKYYEELEHPNDNFIDEFELVAIPGKELDLSKEDNDRCLKLIASFEQKDPLFNKAFGNIKTNIDIPYLDGEVADLIVSSIVNQKFNIEDTNNYIDGEVNELKKYGITKNIYLRFMHLSEIFNNKRNIFYYNLDENPYDKWFSDFKSYIDSCLYLMSNYDVEIDIRKYLDKISTVLLYQDKISKKEYDDINDYVISLNKKYTVKKEYKLEPIKYRLPNAWYITKSGELYNTGGSINKEGQLIGGHGGQSLKYFLSQAYRDVFHACGKSVDEYDKPDLFNEYTPGWDNFDRKISLARKEFTETRQREYFDMLQYKHYINMTYIPATVINNIQKGPSYFDRICFNKNILNVILGIMAAELDAYDFFEKMKNESNDPVRDCQTMMKLLKDEDSIVDEIFIRCFGFHKIQSDVNVHNPNTIVTSDINYKETLKEYIDRGWNIDFVKPYVFSDGVLQELPDYINNIMEFHYNAK